MVTSFQYVLQEVP